MFPTALGRLEISASKALVHYKVIQIDSRVTSLLTPFSRVQDRSALTCAQVRAVSHAAVVDICASL